MPALHCERPEDIVPADLSQAKASLGGTPLAKRLGLPGSPEERLPAVPTTPRTPKSPSSMKSIWKFRYALAPFSHSSCMEYVAPQLLDNLPLRNPVHALPSFRAHAPLPSSSQHHLSPPKTPPRAPYIRQDRAHVNTRTVDLPVTPYSDYFASTTADLDASIPRGSPRSFLCPHRPDHRRSPRLPDDQLVPSPDLAAEGDVSVASGRSGAPSSPSSPSQDPLSMRADKLPVFFVVDPSWNPDQGEPRFCRVSDATGGQTMVDVPDYLWDTPGETHQVFLQPAPRGRKRARRAIQAMDKPVMP
ncbi:hypothetical protein HDZ31DRAFT_42770 [Schizophyllum fasciatum]